MKPNLNECGTCAQKAGSNPPPAMRDAGCMTGVTDTYGSNCNTGEGPKGSGSGNFREPGYAPCEKGA